MNEVIEVLMYIFEKHMSKNCQIAMSDEAISQELSGRGFRANAINKALDWLNGLLELQKRFGEPASQAAMRIFNFWEYERLDVKCRGFLIALEQMGILNCVTRELVIDRLMALDVETVDLAEVKWVTLMVLYNQPNKDAVLACMEKLVLQDTIGEIH